MIVPRTVIGFISFSNQGVTGSLILFTLLDTRSWTKKGRNNRVQFRISSIVGKICHLRLRNANRHCHFVDQWTEKRGRGVDTYELKSYCTIHSFQSSVQMTKSQYSWVKFQTKTHGVLCLLSNSQRCILHYTAIVFRPDLSNVAIQIWMC